MKRRPCGVRLVARAQFPDHSLHAAAGASRAWGPRGSQGFTKVRSTEADHVGPASGRNAFALEEHFFMATTAFPSRDDFAAMLNESLGGENEAFEGRVVKGTVTGIENDLAVIDVGLKSEGRVPLREFAMPGQKSELKVGDTVEVYVDRVENAQGEAMLSRDRARREAAWDKLEKEFE
jgi:hypothetical protein